MLLFLLDHPGNQLKLITRQKIREQKATLPQQYQVLFGAVMFMATLMPVKDRVVMLV